jgi:hypothetical protein
MQVTGIFLPHQAAKQSGKIPFFFSRYIHGSIKARGNTHYCFHCGGDVGFTPGPKGLATNSAVTRTFDPMESHHPIHHADAIVDSADKFDTADAWLTAKVPKDFPFLIAIR